MFVAFARRAPPVRGAGNAPRHVAFATDAPLVKGAPALAQSVTQYYLSPTDISSFPDMLARPMTDDPPISQRTKGHAMTVASARALAEILAHNLNLARYNHETSGAAMARDIISDVRRTLGPRALAAFDRAISAYDQEG